MAAVRYHTARPIDLAALLALAALAVAGALTLREAHPLRVALALPFLLFAPGYALVAALFPERGRTYEVAKGEEGQAREEVSEGLDPLERVALSVGLSIAVVPLLALGLNFTPWGIRLVPILVAVAVFISLCVPVAWARRADLPEGERLSFTIEVGAGAWSRMAGLDRALTLLLAISVVAAGGAIAYALTAPRPQETFTEFYVLDARGRVDAYPNALAPGQNATIIVGIVSHEGRTVDYAWTAVYISGAVQGEGANRTFVPANETVVETRRLALQDEAEREENWTFRAPTVPGAYKVELRLTKDGEAEVYRRLHLWIEVA